MAKIDRDAFRVSTYLGLQVAIIMGLGFTAGFYLDEYLKTLPLFTLICCALAFAAAIYAVIAGAKRDEKKRENKK